MNSEEDHIFNHGKRFWKPFGGNNVIGLCKSLPLLNLVSVNNHRKGITKKCCYKMKINQIGVQMNSENMLALTNNSNYIRRKSYVELKKKEVSVEPEEKLIQVRYMNYNIKRTFVSRMIIDGTESTFERLQPEKHEISFSRSSNYSSSSLSSEDLTAGVRQENRLQYLQTKYMLKWKTFVDKRIISRRMAKKQSTTHIENAVSEFGRPQSSNKLTYEREEFGGLKQQNYKRKMIERINTATELQLDRLKQEEELFTRDVQGMLKENIKPTIKSDSKSVVPNRSNKGDPKKMDKSKLRAGWDLVTRMELRAQERQQRWEDIRERKQRLEIEKAEKMRIEEEKRRQMEDEEKKQRVLKVKQEIKRRVILKKMQEEERVRLGKLNMKADELYKIHLLKSSLATLVLYVEQCRISMAYAWRYHDNKLLTESLIALNLFRRIEITKKIEAASEFHETSLLKRTFDTFKKIHMDHLQQTKKSEEFNRFRMIRNYFSIWFLYHVDHKCRYLEKEEFAFRHYERSLMKRCFQNWKLLPLMHFQEREKEQRFRSWCSKIQELLPDFQPSE